MMIRPIEDGDWDQVWPIFAETVAAGETYAYPENLTSDEARALWVEEPPGRTVVLEDGTVLGTAKMGPNRPGRGDHIGTASFMVAPGARGRGVGRDAGPARRHRAPRPRGREPRHVFRHVGAW